MIKELERRFIDNYDLLALLIHPQSDPVLSYEQLIFGLS